MRLVKGFCAAILLGAAILGAPPVARAAESVALPGWCPKAAQDRSVSRDPQFRALSDKLRRRETIVLVAIGSSSTEGSDLSDQGLAYPAQLEQRLNGLFGERSFRVLNKGKGGETLPETVARFASDVTAQKPDLVIWQLGVNDVVRSVDPALSALSIARGFAELSKIEAPVVLMDMQVAPRVLKSATLDATRKLLGSMARRHEAMLWSRFDLMDGILRRGAASIEDLVKPDELHMTVPMHACAGAALADAIAAYLPQRGGIEISSVGGP